MIYLILFASAFFFGWASYKPKRKDEDGQINFLMLAHQASLSWVQQVFERNKKMCEECRAEEDTAWRKWGLAADEIFAWWDLFCAVHNYPKSAPYNFPWTDGFRIFTLRMVHGNGYEVYLPKLPRPLLPKEMYWSIWKRDLLPKLSEAE